MSDLVVDILPKPLVSSILNKPVCVSKVFALKVSLTFILVESVDLNVLPLISIVPKVCVEPEAVTLFVTVKSLGIVISLGKD